MTIALNAGTGATGEHVLPPTRATSLRDPSPSTGADKATRATGLGNTGIKRNPQVKATKATEVSRTERVARDRHSTMVKVTLDKDLRWCHIAPRSSEVMIVHNGGGVEGTISGLQNTHSRWGSPLAARDIQHKHKTHLGIAIKNWLDGGEGRSVVFAVNTVRHHRGDGLGLLLDGLRSGFTAMHDGNWSRDKKHYGIAHHHSDYEHTWGWDNGHHPHKNTVYFLDKVLSDTELEALQASMFGRYVQGVVGAGLKAPTAERGLSLQQLTGWGADAATVAGYIGKGAFSLAAEMKGSATKTAGEGHFTPGEMLDLLGSQHSESGEYHPVVLAAYREYEREFKGLRSSWSRGAKKALGIDYVTDEVMEAMEAEMFELAGVEVVERPKPEKRMGVAAVSSGEWKKIRESWAARDAVTAACGLAETPEAAQAAVGAVLDAYGVAWSPRMTPMDEVDLDAVMPSSTQAFARDLGAAVWSGNEQRLVPLVG